MKDKVPSANCRSRRARLNLNGIFDYEGAAWADRHHDFRYLVFALDQYDLFESASSAYEAAAP